MLGDASKIKERIFFLACLIALLLVGGTIVYSVLEGWNIIDSLYFSTVTLTTIGYGDMYPTTYASKLFTVFFVLSGVGLMLFVLSMTGAYYLNYLEANPFVQTTTKKAFNRINKRKEDRWITIPVREKKE
jgi:hypothetical protein